MTYPRVAVVGAGALASKQIYPNLAPAGLKLVAVCDLDLAKAAARCEQYGGRAYSDFEALLAEGGLDGVILCVGPEFHCQGAKRVLAAGLGVYTEKPPAPSADALWPVVELARASGLVAMTAMKKRYATVYRRARDFITSEAFGEARQLQMFRVSPFHWDHSSARRDHLLDYGVHNLDLACWLFGPVAKVRAETIDRHTYQITLRFLSGALGSLSFVERLGAASADETLELTGSAGWMNIRNQSQYRLQSRAGIEIRDPDFSLSGGDGGAVGGHRSELEAFAAALRDGTAPASQVEESYRSMCVYDAILRALASESWEEVVDRSR